MRCLTLADAVRARGASCTFVCRESEGHLCDVIEARGHKVFRLSGRAGRLHAPAPESAVRPSATALYSGWLGIPQAEDAGEMARVLEQTLADIVVVDHYALNSEWERRVRPWCKGIIAIDDLANRPHDCDVLLDQNLGRLATDYDGLVPTHCNRLIGPGYALLRPEFAELRAESLARRTDGQCRRILVTMGGVDADNVTGAVLAALDSARLPADVRVTVVLGASAPWKDSVRTQARGMRLQTEVVVNATNMAELMRDADLAIGAAGSTAWERCCMGLPSVAVVLAPNQMAAARCIAKAGATVVIENRVDLSSGVRACVQSLILDVQYLRAVQKSAASIVDGLGSERVCSKLYSLLGGWD